MDSQIVLVNVKPRPLAAVRVTTSLGKWPAQFLTELNKVYAVIRAGNVRQTGQNVAIYFPRKDGQFDIACGVEIEAKFEHIGEVEYCETPAGQALTMAHIGPYDRLKASHRAVDEWGRQNSYRLSGICWEIYGDWDENPTKLRTDIFHLLEK
jgi:effector-binding domain-containing protein